MSFFLGWISSCSIFFSILVLGNNAKFESLDIKFIRLYLYMTLGVELLNAILIFKHQNTLLSDNIYSLIEILILCMIAIFWNDKNNKNKIQLTFIFIFTILSFTYQLHFGLNKIYPELKIANSIVLIIIYYIYLIGTESLFNRKNIYKLIFSLAVLFYFLMNSIIFSFQSILLSNYQKEFWVLYLWIHSIINIIFNLLIGLSILKWKKN